jgi:hypothetical protein
MEDVLHVYSMPFNPDIPVVCMDEKPYQLLSEAREPLPIRPGNKQKLDSEYIREGTCSIFVFTETLANFRHVSVREHRTKKDWAEEVKYLLTELYPDKEKIILVMDNLNTHTKASLYQSFPPEKAFELAKRLEIHYTPKHGSWLNIAEIELNVMTRQCLKRRISDIEILSQQLSVWEQERNSKKAIVQWQFKTADARIKLASLYPKLV